MAQHTLSATLLTLQAYTGSGEKSTKTLTTKFNDTGMGLTYTVTPGMKVSVTHNDFTGKGGNNCSFKQTAAALHFAIDVSF